MSEFRMPSLGADMQYGTVVEWRVKPGDAVKRGDVVALVETEKGVIEVEVFESGVIESLVIQPGQKVPVGTTLATLSGDGKKAVPQAAASPMAVAPVMPASLQERSRRLKLSLHQSRRKLRGYAFRRLQGSARRNWAWNYHMSPAQVRSIQLQWPMSSGQRKRRNPRQLRRSLRRLLQRKVWILRGCGE